MTTVHTIADVLIATLKASGVRRVYGLPGDALNGLTDAIRRDGDIEWQHVRHEEAAGFAAAGDAAVTGDLAADRGPLHPQTIIAAVDRIASDDAVFIPDVGTPALWAARSLTMNGRRRLIGPFNHGSMANALPQAIGVQSAQPDRQVVALSGDCGLAMLLGELLTLRPLRLPVKVVVLNNNALSFVDSR